VQLLFLRVRIWVPDDLFGAISNREQRFTEIRLRAYQRIGELSRDLEKAGFIPGKGACVPSDGKTKEQTLAEAGISTSTANRYEELAGPKSQVSEPHGRGSFGKLSPRGVGPHSRP